jgi:hypothetical protein
LEEGNPAGRAPLSAITWQGLGPADAGEALEDQLRVYFTPGRWIGLYQYRDGMRPLRDMAIEPGTRALCAEKPARLDGSLQQDHVWG